MLVLSRRNKEQIVLPGLGITITILESKNNKVSIGIDAPREIQITRPGAKRPAGLRRIVTVENNEHTWEPDCVPAKELVLSR